MLNRFWRVIFMITPLALGVACWYFSLFSKVRPAFFLQNICVYGQSRTSAGEILWAVGIARHQSLWTQSLKNIHGRLLQLPWVRQAILRRRLPHSIDIYLQERLPVAIWQHKGARHLVDQEGELVKAPLCHKFPHLPVITGQDAPRHWGSFYKMCQSLAPTWQVKGACLFPSRRWDIYIYHPGHGHIHTLRLPYINLEEALSTLYDQWQRWQAYGVLDARMSGALLLGPCTEPNNVLPSPATRSIISPKVDATGKKKVSGRKLNASRPSA